MTPKRSYSPEEKMKMKAELYRSMTICDANPKIAAERRRRVLELQEELARSSVDSFLNKLFGVLGIPHKRNSGLSRSETEAEAVSKLGKKIEPQTHGERNGR